jgi:hypothetical protein
MCAWAGLGAIATGKDALRGQAILAALYLTNDVLVGGNACYNLFEIWAGLKDGGHRC